MINFLGKQYYIDIDEIDKWIEIDDGESKINVVRFDLIKMFLEAVLFSTDRENDKLAMKVGESPEFILAFNTLLHKKIIKSY